MQLWRAHGLGNDYLVLESGETMHPDRVRALCDRHTGVGSDGLLEPCAPVGADFGVRIWNPDGSIAEKSGNGLRIYARWLADHGAGAQFSVWTGFDVVRCEVGDAGVRIEMGRAALRDLGGPLQVGADALDVVALSVGNPHAVVFVDGLPEAAPWRAWGEALEVHPAFPNRTNVQVVQVVAPDTLEIRIWERGAGPTLASGSSSCAAAAAAVATGRMAPGRLRVRMPGGELAVSVSEALEVVLEGPVGPIGRISLDSRWAP